MSFGIYRPEDPIDAKLRALGISGTPDERLEVIVRAYEDDRGDELERPPDEPARRKVYDWLRDRHTQGLFASLGARLPARRNLYFEDVPAQVSALQQLECLACEWTYPSYNLPIQVLPWSAQSQTGGRNVRIKTAVHSELKLRHPEGLSIGPSEPHPIARLSPTVRAEEPQWWCGSAPPVLPVTDYAVARAACSLML